LKHCAPFECPVEASDDEASDDAEPIEASAAGWHTAAAIRAAADTPPASPAASDEDEPIRASAVGWHTAAAARAAADSPPCCPG
jgi:hypothetical protein